MNQNKDNLLIRAAKKRLLDKQNKAPAAKFAKGATARNKALQEAMRQLRGGR